MSKYIIKPVRPVINRAHPLAKGLVGCWPFFERGGTTLRDISGKNNNGTLTNMDAATDWVKTPYGYGLDFDGVDDYVISGPSKTGISNLTIVIWFKPTGAQATTGIFQWANALSYYSPWILLQRTNATTVRWYLNGDYRITHTVNDNTLYRVVLTYDGTTWSSYLNNETPLTYVGPIGPDGGNNVYLGNGYNGYFSGFMYEVRIYNRVLTSSEMRQSYTDLWGLYRPTFVSKKYIPVSFLGLGTAPTLSNLVVSSGTSNGELSVSFNYSDVNIVDNCEVAVARTDTDLPTGTHTGTETDSLVYNVFKPIYKTSTGELPAMAGLTSGTYSVTLKLPDSGKVYVTVSASNSLGNWSNWMTPASGTVKGVATGESSYGMVG